VEPRIRYTRTTDGVSIAYWEHGQGEPLILLPGYPLSHLQLELRVPEWHAFYERLARNRRVVRYDGRGMGLSQREVRDLDFDTMLLDLDAVVKATGGRANLMGIAFAGALALHYAARNPGAVERLMLWCSFAVAQPPPPEVEWETPLMRAHWEHYCNVFVSAVFGWENKDSVEGAIKVLREGLTPEMGIRLRGVLNNFDIRDELGEVQAPTMVMHRRGYPMMQGDVGMKLASSIPGAHLALFEGSSVAPFLGESEPVYAAIDEFLGDVPVSDENAPAALRTILFTDVENHTAMIQRLGDADSREVLREHERITRAALRIHGGREVKSMGDGFLAWFPSATQALECAVDLQRAFDDHNRGSAERLSVRIGINAGEPIEDNNDLFGTAVVAASRIASQASGGQVLVSNVVRELVAGKGYLFSDRGEVVLRGLEEPVRIFEVGWGQ
jgi:class 3 adenylate cyclase/pimeloyl-ACP methyl ester carboxylesterase